MTFTPVVNKMAHALGNLFDIEDPKRITTPPLSRKKSVSIRTPPSDQELDDLIFGDRLSAPQTHPSTPKSGSEHATSSRPPSSHTGVQTPVTPSELEGAIANTTTPPAADGGPAHAAIQTFWNPPMNKWRVLCACLVYFGNGLSDSAPGALIPYMETFYGIGYAVVSLVFVANAVGFVSAAFCTDGLLLARLGRARTLVVSELIMLAGYVVLVCTPPAFAGVVAAFFLLGFGCAINLALNNVFCSTLANSTLLLGLTHGSYGVGGTVGPIVATALAGSGVLWSRFYFLTMAVRVVCVMFNAWAFWNYEKENSGDDVVVAGAAAVATEANLLTELEQTASRRAAAESEAEIRAEGEGDARQQQQQPQQQTTSKPTKRELLKQALRNRVTVGGALFIFMYQGAEVAIAGWVISFLIDYRGGDPAQVGYVTAGFFVSSPFLTHFFSILSNLPPQSKYFSLYLLKTSPNLTLQTGRHHPRPLRPRPLLPPPPHRRRAPRRRHLHAGRFGPRPARLARAQPALQRRLRRAVRPAPGARLPLRPDRLRPPAARPGPPPPHDRRRRLHLRRRQQRRRPRAVRHWRPRAGEGEWDVGSASGLRGGVCGDVGVLVGDAEREEGEGEGVSE